MLCFASAASASGYSDGGRDLSRGTAKSSRRVCIRLASRPAAHESRHRPACHVERVVNDCDIVRPRRLGDRSRRLSTGRRVEEPTVHPCSNRASHACNARGSTSASVFCRKGASPFQVYALRLVADRNCVAVRRGGEYREANGQSATKVNSIRPGVSASLLPSGEAQTGNGSPRS